jgi:hypothetical protein
MRCRSSAPHNTAAQSQPRPYGSLGGCMTGPLLAGLAGAHVAAINAGAVPAIATAWQGVAEAECRRAAEAAEAAYAAAFSEVRGGGCACPAAWPRSRTTSVCWCLSGAAQRRPRRGASRLPLQPSPPARRACRQRRLAWPQSTRAAPPWPPPPLTTRLSATQPPARRTSTRCRRRVQPGVCVGVCGCAWVRSRACAPRLVLVCTPGHDALMPLRHALHLTGSRRCVRASWLRQRPPSASCCCGAASWSTTRWQTRTPRQTACRSSCSSLWASSQRLLPAPLSGRACSSSSCLPTHASRQR